MNPANTNDAASRGESALQRGVRPLDDQLRRLAALFREDFGRELSPGLMQRVRWWCADKAVPSVSADCEGAICATWKTGDESLVVRLQPSGAAQWAGHTDGRRTFGDGYPPADQWRCLRPAFHFRKGWRGDMKVTHYKQPNVLVTGDQRP